MTKNRDTIVTEEDKQKAEQQIRALRKSIEYTTRDHSIKFLIDKFKAGDFVIERIYQRQSIWSNEQKSLFIESILLGLPIPFMFFVDIAETGKCEIIDGAQRIQALAEFIDNDLRLSNLKKLTLLNKFKFVDLPFHFKTKFCRSYIRVVELSKDTNLELKQEIFSRINTTGKIANPIEVRRGKYMRSPFMDFIQECSENELFKKLCPLSTKAKLRYKDQELIASFFAYLYDYQNFNPNVNDVVSNFIEAHQREFEKVTLEKEFTRMLEFVDLYFPHGFAKTQNSKSIPRVHFMAIAVGVALALREKEQLAVDNVKWLDSKHFIPDFGKFCKKCICSRA